MGFSVFLFSAVCHGDCLNGGKCIGPNTCQCRHGYIGPNCELGKASVLVYVYACGCMYVCVLVCGGRAGAVHEWGEGRGVRVYVCVCVCVCVCVIM